jgi:hypothetical protein
MKWAVGFLLLIVVPLALGELTDWCPWLAARLIKRAARLLPQTVRARYQMEWLGDLHQTPGRLAKLAWAMSLPVAAIRVRWAVQPPPLAESN